MKGKAKTLCECGRLHLGQTLIVSYCHGSMNSAGRALHTVHRVAEGTKAQLEWSS